MEFAEAAEIVAFRLLEVAAKLSCAEHEPQTAVFGAQTQRMVAWARQLAVHEPPSGQLARRTAPWKDRPDPTRSTSAVPFYCLS